MREGGCFCGAIKYKVGGEPVQVTHCHCEHCRRTSAAAFVTWAEFRSADFTFTKGKPAEFSSRPTVTRSFCPKCGTPLTYRCDDTPASVDVTVCSLDDPGRLSPRDHVWSDRMLPWVRLEDGLHRYARGRTGS